MHEASRPSGELTPASPDACITLSVRGVRDVTVPPSASRTGSRTRRTASHAHRTRRAAKRFPDPADGDGRAAPGSIPGMALRPAHVIIKALDRAALGRPWAQALG
ncbi:hypothetical protein GCM10010499_40880 [Streptomyces thermoviolaceus subsp. apingens]|nr:hypothetical protein GCM10010499_40880 [Streptomyces thermoviolaceus subsp. apingens]